MSWTDAFQLDNRGDYYDALAAAQTPEQQWRALEDLNIIRGYPDFFAEEPAIGSILGGLAGTAAAYPTGAWLADNVDRFKSAGSDVAGKFKQGAQAAGDHLTEKYSAAIDALGNSGKFGADVIDVGKTIAEELKSTIDAAGNIQDRVAQAGASGIEQAKAQLGKYEERLETAIKAGNSAAAAQIQEQINRVEGIINSSRNAIHIDLDEGGDLRRNVGVAFDALSEKMDSAAAEIPSAERLEKVRAYIDDRIRAAKDSGKETLAAKLSAQREFIEEAFAHPYDTLRSVPYGGGAAALAKQNPQFLGRLAAGSVLVPLGASLGATMGVAAAPEWRQSMLETGQIDQRTLGALTRILEDPNATPEAKEQAYDTLEIAADRVDLGITNSGYRNLGMGAGTLLGTYLGGKYGKQAFSKLADPKATPFSWLSKTRADQGNEPYLNALAKNLTTIFSGPNSAKDAETLGRTGANLLGYSAGGLAGALTGLGASVAASNVYQGDTYQNQLDILADEQASPEERHEAARIMRLGHDKLGVDYLPVPLGETAGKWVGGIGGTLLGAAIGARNSDEAIKYLLSNRDVRKNSLSYIFNKKSSDKAKTAQEALRSNPEVQKNMQLVSANDGRVLRLGAQDAAIGGITGGALGSMGGTILGADYEDPFSE